MFCYSNMHYDGNYRDVSPPLHFRLLEFPSLFLRWTLVPALRRSNTGGKILYYHEIKKDEFRKHIKYLKKHYDIVYIDEFIGKINKNEPIPDEYVAIVFDDGRRTLYPEVYPIINEFDVPITVYLVTGAVREGTYFWDKVNALQEVGVSPGSVEELATLPVDERNKIIKANLDDHDISLERTSLNWAEISELHHAGVDFQCHTKTHPSLPALERGSINREITKSADTIEEQLNTKVTHFSYPFGHSSDEVIEVLQRIGFKSAVGVEAGNNTNDSNPYDLRRISAESASVPLLSSLIEGVWHKLVPGKSFYDR